MRRFSKLITLLLTLALLLSLATTAFADGTTGSFNITVKDALAGATYKAYKVFDVTVDANKPSYSYTITGSSTNANPFFNAVQTFAEDPDNGLTLEKISGTDTYNVTFDSTKYTADGGKQVALAAALAAAVKDGNITETKSVTVGTDQSTAVISDLAEGCYLIPSPIGSTSVLITVVANEEIEEKNGLPSLKKEVNKTDDATAQKDWAKANDTAFGATVEFKIEIQVDKTEDDYVLTDKLPSEFTLKNDSIGVQYAKYDANGNSYETETDVGDTNYTLQTQGLGTGESFKITFYGSYLETLSANDKLIVTYSATVGDIAVVAGAGNVNTATLVYGNATDAHTLSDYTTTYVWSFDVFKFVNTGTPATETPLAGAKFQLSTDEAGTNVVYFTQDTTNKTVYKKTNDTTDTVYIITTSTDAGANGTFTLRGLDSGTYYLTETEAPAGYNRLEGPIKVVIGSKDGTTAGTLTAEVTYGNWKKSVGNDDNEHYEATLTEATQNKIPVENRAGSVLPSTGGIGTTIFYVLGGILVVGAGVLLIVKKRMGSAE